MRTTKEFLLALLSMDSYNRGYAEAIAGLGGFGSRVGQAILTTDSEFEVTTKETAKAAGFYASSYEFDGTTVISYRGSDLFFADGDIGGDGVNGYGIAFGSPGGPQYNLAIQFYKSVLEDKLGVDDPNSLTAEQLKNSGIIVTGHSLGAGLAVDLM